MVFGISIPIIIRHGEGEAKLAIHHPCLIQEGDKTYLEAQLTRGGNHSAYFDFSASQVQNGEKTELASRRGMAIYAPNGSRRVRAKIKEGIGISDGPILIELHDREKKDHALLGEWTFTLDEI
ncbi:MAG: hypothetical protein MI749_11675 [Desulfovibrionales bacterium]|nr:hypothetical protein [Desulfovibrionales bacterium]